MDEPSGRLVVFVHGLGGSERSWPTGPGDRTSYIDLLEDGLGATALALRYNSGRHVSDNGRGAVRPPRAAGARLAGAGGITRPRRALDGWARGPLRLPRRRRARPGVAVPGAPRRLPGHAPPRCAARAGRPARPQRPRSARRDAAAGRAGSGSQRRHQGPLPRLRRRGGLDADGDADGIDDHRHLLPLLPDAEHCFVAATVTGPPGPRRSARGPVRALPQRRAGGAGGAPRTRASRPTTSTSAAPATSSCCTTPRSASSSSPGSGAISDSTSALPPPPPSRLRRAPAGPASPIRLSASSCSAWRLRSVTRCGGRARPAGPPRRARPPCAASSSGPGR